ncbi:AAA family ATPase [Mangrovibacillus cuniculi]|uniref:AAA family ATPase n=1 Tax=Mangrovibacillus cuniculi TaxID=2593652 RepID=A0A7S8CE18_9BACI|nr:AAA family ATPase [Mangrovibacillus cuniculi]QPC48270.1 AAA family ATPase [Mangrovibacillus cuniculi]
MEENVKILVVSDDELIHNEVVNAIPEPNKVQIVEPKDVAREIHRDVCDVLIYIQPIAEDAVESIQYIKAISPDTLVIFVAKNTDFLLLRNITKAGVTEFFIYPDEISLLINRLPSMIKAYEVKKNKKEDTVSYLSKGRGQIMSVFSGNGGTGKSVLASSLAQTLKLESTAEVLLIDLNLQFGGMETLLSIESNRSLADLMPVMEELNENHIRNVSQRLESSKLEILLSPCDAEVAESITDAFIAKLLRTSRRSFDFVIVDLPSYLNSNVVTTLEESDRIFYVLTPDTPSLHVLKQFEETALRLGIELKSRTSILFNKASKENEIQEKDMKELLRFPIISSVRWDHKGLQPYVNKGEPVRKEEKEKRLTPFAKDVRKWSLSLLK